MKYALLAAFAVSSVMSGALLAQGQTIVVTSHRDAVTQWASAVSRDLDRTLRYPRFLGPQQPATGVVSVRFNCSDDGRADNVVVSRRSGSRALDRAAIQAISQITSLHPIPGELATDQLVQANIYFAADESDLQQQKAQLRRERAASWAARKGDNHLVALNLVVRVPG